MFSPQNNEHQANTLYHVIRWLHGRVIYCSVARKELENGINSISRESSSSLPAIVSSFQKLSSGASLCKSYRNSEIFRLDGI